MYTPQLCECVCVCVPGGGVLKILYAILADNKFNIRDSNIIHKLHY